ncbi:hypothetical protein FH972_026260 [Carpinus fangiana]|uniref:Uncharacterized protein n=1 Tax=Carpinus fangiana TaxID=176857 RepID=A0A5N6L3G5_9ROSI|nr:hypothetical protein FH972_026260 [Carpinus fangiana]
MSAEAALRAQAWLQSLGTPARLPQQGLNDCISAMSDHISSKDREWLNEEHETDLVTLLGTEQDHGLMMRLLHRPLLWFSKDEVGYSNHHA